MTAPGPARRAAPLLLPPLLLFSLLVSGPPARAADGAREHAGAFLRLAFGPTVMRESRNPNGGAAGSAYAGAGPSFELAWGRHLRPGLALAGFWQLTTIRDRQVLFRDGWVPLDDTLHACQTLGVLVDSYPNPARGFHWGGALGLLAVTDVDTNFFGAHTGWGLAAHLHAGFELFVSRRWSGGVIARVSAYRYGAAEHEPPAASTGVLSSLLLGFTYD